METVNGFSTGGIQFLVNWGPITFSECSYHCSALWYRTSAPPSVTVPFSIPIGIWIDKDLRLSTITSIVLVAAGAVLRCFALDASITSTVLLHASYICNGIAGPSAMGAVSLIAERWFPVAERSTATAVMAEANSFGLGAAFLVGPNMISSSGDVKDLLNFYILCAVLISANLVRFGLAFGVTRYLAAYRCCTSTSPDRSVGLLSVASAITANQVCPSATDSRVQDDFGSLHDCALAAGPESSILGAVCLLWHDDRDIRAL